MVDHGRPGRTARSPAFWFTGGVCLGFGAGTTEHACIRPNECQILASLVGEVALGRQLSGAVAFIHALEPALSHRLSGNATALMCSLEGVSPRPRPEMGR